MANIFGTPVVLTLIPIDSTGSEVFDESNQTTVDPFPCTFDDWNTMFAEDLDFDEDIDEYDFWLWWQAQGFDQATWTDKTGLPWPPEN